MGAAMLSGIAGISPATLSNSAAYLQTWIQRLKCRKSVDLKRSDAARQGCLGGTAFGFSVIGIVC